MGKIVLNTAILLAPQKLQPIPPGKTSSPLSINSTLGTMAKLLAVSIPP
jgi:hypothetical protein